MCYDPRLFMKAFLSVRRDASRGSVGRATSMILLGAALAVTVPVTPAAQSEPVTVLYKNRVERIERTLPDPDDLWVTPGDLPRVNDFVLKPEGACLDELCVPVRQDRDSDMFVRRRGQGWFNVTELARKLEQPFVVDHDHGVWSFGAVPVTRNRFLESALAPDFELPDRQGRPVRLSDFRGKKVLLVTWASW